LYIGSDSKHALTAAVNLSNVYKSIGDVKLAEELLLSCLQKSQLTHGDMSTLTATIMNNLGLLLKKDSTRIHQAQHYYEEALKIRSYSLGSQHPDTVISMNNLAELYLSMGQEKVIYYTVIC
jgi:tetratricopeptide (TPR) repeat protein